jgi:UDP-3-O-[3-hydroxymyristoyl] N-acetylglucosamine deacetylase
MKQKTVKNTLTIKGIGLHSGCDSTITIKPAEENFGIWFVRIDKNAKPIKALYSNIVDTKNCSCLGDEDGNLISTVEHFMSAMYIKGSINSIIPELLCCLTGVCMVNKKSKGVKV